MRPLNIILLIGGVVMGLYALCFVFVDVFNPTKRECHKFINCTYTVDSRKYSSWYIWGNGTRYCSHQFSSIPRNDTDCYDYDVHYREYCPCFNKCEQPDRVYFIIGNIMFGLIGMILIGALIYLIFQQKHTEEEKQKLVM